MSATIEINGTTLIPLKEAASAVSYSKDYVARLAREGKIVGSQIGRQWFVDPVSLSHFMVEAKSIEGVRKEELRAIRKHELMAKQALSTLESRASDVETKNRFDALVATLAVLCVGIFTGVGVYTAWLVPETKLASLISPFINTPSLELEYGQRGDIDIEAGQLAQGVSSPFQLVSESEPQQETLVLTTIEERPIFTAEREVVPMSSNGLAGVMLFANQGTVRNEAEIARLFSDSVEVKFTDERSGVVTFAPTPETVFEYPFVTLPVGNASNERIE